MINETCLFVSNKIITRVIALNQTWPTRGSPSDFIFLIETVVSRCMYRKNIKRMKICTCHCCFIHFVFVLHFLKACLPKVRPAVTIGLRPGLL